MVQLFGVKVHYFATCTSLMAIVLLFNYSEMMN